jgi:cytoskeletal protein CcmA (bactofilin family)
MGDFMFTRNSQAEPQPLEPVKTNGNAAAARSPAQQRPRPGTPDGGPKSVIGNDLRIIGQGLKIISQGTLQVDGEIEGDVGGAEVIIGERGRVTGTVAAERVIVRGTISGVIRGVTVTLQSSSHVEGDINHMSLAIEQGAEFDGRCRRSADPSELKVDLGA